MISEANAEVSQTCILSNGQQGVLHWFQKEARFYVS